MRNEVVKINNFDLILWKTKPKKTPLLKIMVVNEWKFWNCVIS
jgi:hypothetical protein